MKLAYKYAKKKESEIIIWTVINGFVCNLSVKKVNVMTFSPLAYVVCREVMFSVVSVCHTVCVFTGAIHVASYMGTSTPMTWGCPQPQLCPSHL